METKEEFEENAARIFISLSNLKHSLDKAPIETVQYIYDKIDAINKLSMGIMLRCDVFNEALDGRDEIELMKKAGM
ncbi:MAG: hypothetical protein JKY52_08360 [Flavobacteriales bacterium]|nr:hypothetical protein [Flavobacteriales bacterium]